MSAIHIKKIKGREYAYEVTSYWDKELKKRRKKTVYIGRVIDKENGVYEKLKKNEDNFSKSMKSIFLFPHGDTMAANPNGKQDF